MRVGLLAEKIGMSRFYDKDNINHSVTVLKINNCKVIAKKNNEKNGYLAVTLCHGDFKKHLGKPFKHFLKKNNLKPFYVSKEFRVDDKNELKIGDDVGASNFVVGQYVDVSANSKGKGFAGPMKRHNFSGNRATHGVSISHRSHGSTGQCQDPGKVFKGKKMAGRLGNKKVTIQNLKVLKVDTDNNLLILKGAIPGHKGSVISIIDSVKKNQDINVSNDNSIVQNTSSNKNEIVATDVTSMQTVESNRNDNTSIENKAEVKNNEAKPKDENTSNNETNVKKDEGKTPINDETNK